jgi:hypothetical protein
MQTKSLTLSPYNQSWPDIFASEAIKIKKALGDISTRAIEFDGF